LSSVEAFFTSLSKQQTMLLLTAVTFGGTESLGAFDHLGGDHAEVLKHRAQEMLQIPREQRIPLLVQEIKRLVTAKRGYLWAADPEKLAKVLRGERQALVEVLLRALPAQVADEVRKHLPPSKLKLKKDVKSEILSVVRWKLEEVLSRTVSPKVTFRFADVLVLQSRDLLTLCDRIGARGLAAAVAGLEDAERDGFLGALPPDLKTLVTKAVEAAPTRKLAPKDAQDLIHLHADGKGPVEAIRNAGAHRLARACLAQSPEFAGRVLDRHKGELSHMLGKWLRQERAKGQPRGDAGRAEVVLELERLAEAGVIDRLVRLSPPKSAGPPRPAGIPPPPRRGPDRGHGPSSDRAAERSPGRSDERSGPGLQEIPVVGARQEKPLLGPPRLGPRSVPPPPEEERSQRFRDPIAERQARRAGAVSSRAPREPPPPDSQVTKPPFRPRPLGSERPRSVLKPGQPPPKRGPRGR
jgi:hypothetical protein